MKKRIENDSLNKIVSIVLVLFLIISIILVTSIFLVNNKKTDYTHSNNSEIELSHTEINTTIKEGVYITDVSEVVEKAMPSIVAITSKTLIQSGYFGPSFFGNSNKQYSEGAGSGIIISQTDSEILILTNNHVVDDATELTVKFIDDSVVDATIKGTSERKDIAVISVKMNDVSSQTKEQIKIATIGNSNNLKVGNGIVAIGNALGYGQSVTTGVISALNRTLTGDEYNNKMIQIDAAINGGNSGGALLNSAGEVIGINSAKYSNSGYSNSASIEGMGFAIPISDIENLINDLINGKEESKGITLGIEGYMTTELNSYNLPEGFYISKIIDNSNAAKSELEIGNIITEVDNNKIKNATDISNILYEKKSGDTIKLKIKYISGREYKEKEIIIKLS